MENIQVLVIPGESYLTGSSGEKFFLKNSTRVLAVLNDVFGIKIEITVARSLQDVMEELAKVVDWQMVFLDCGPFDAVKAARLYDYLFENRPGLLKRLLFWRDSGKKIMYDYCSNPGIHDQNSIFDVRSLGLTFAEVIGLTKGATKHQMKIISPRN